MTHLYNKSLFLYKFNDSVHRISTFNTNVKLNGMSNISTVFLVLWIRSDPHLLARYLNQGFLTHFLKTLKPDLHIIYAAPQHCFSSGFKRDERLR